jgi:hypothetical protein
MLLEGLKREGWEVREGLMVPHATSPDHKTRLWFKARAVYMNDLGTDPRDYKNTHSLSSDIREYVDLRGLLNDIAIMRRIQHGSKPDPAGNPGSPEFRA